MEAPDYRFLDLAGSHADLGYELGSQDPPFKMQPWWAAPASLHFTNECLTVLNEVAPALVEENKAYAEAQRHHLRHFGSNVVGLTSRRVFGCRLVLHPQMMLKAARPLHGGLGRIC